MAPRSLPPPSKKRKVTREDHADAIKTLENEITNAIAKDLSLNPLADLLALVLELQDPHDTSKGIYALYRVFVILISNNKLNVAGDEAAAVVKAWIWERLNTFVDFLGGLLQDEEKFLRTSGLSIMFSLLKHLSSAYSSSQPQFHVSHFRKIVSALLLCPPSQRVSKPATGLIDSDVLDLFYETWFSVFDDVRWFFLRESVTLLNDHPGSQYPNLAVNLLSILERLTTFPTDKSELNEWWVPELGTKPPKPKKTTSKNASSDDSSEEADDSGGDGDGDTEDDWRKFFEDEPAPADDGKGAKSSVRLHKLTVHQSLHALASHRAVFTRAWLTLLPRLSAGGSGASERGKALATRALNLMHRGVLPHLTRPVLVMDWIGACVDMGGSVGLLALNALFVLMKDYNLDYPSFYTRLYAFLDRDLLHLKHRSRFFRLTELFLSSTHLPATLLASFVKRLSRLSLNAPPAAIVMVIPFTYNILKNHPALMVMIHRADAVNDDCADPFLPDEPNPINTHALDSSLWELLSHTAHYHAPVSTMCKIFSEAFTKPHYAMEDFLDHTYNTLIETEVTRKIKREPALGLETAVKVFPETSKSTTTKKSKTGSDNEDNDDDDDEEEEEDAEEGDLGDAMLVDSAPVDVVGQLWAFS